MNHISEDTFEQVLQIFNDTTIIDFRKVYFIDPYRMVGILWIGEFIKSNGIQKNHSSPCIFYKLHKEQMKNGSSDLVTRQSGQVIRERIERDIVREAEGEVIALDFSKIGIIDYSCADEIVAKLVSRLVSGEYGDKYIVLKGLNENQKEDIEVALERKNLAVMAEVKKSGVRSQESEVKVLLGSLNNYLLETLNLILHKGKITAGELSEELNLPANTSGTRLLNLYKKKLVRRLLEARTEGRVWVYIPCM